MKTDNLIVEELNSNELIAINGGSEFSEAVAWLIGATLRYVHDTSKELRANPAFGNANVYK